MAETAAGSRSCSLCFTRPSLLCLLVSVPFLVFSCFLGIWFLPFLATISVLVLSNVLLVTFTKKKVVLDGNPDHLVQDDELMSCTSKDLQGEVDTPAPEELLSETDVVANQYKASNQVKGNQILHEHSFKSPEIEFEMKSESDDGDDEDEELMSQNLGLNWVCPNNVDEESTEETSDDTISASSDDEDDEDDDDSLIEIALPGKESKQKFQSNLPEDLLSGSILGEEGLVELLEEINEMDEEDNLIEVDISRYDLYELDVKNQVF